MSAPTTLLEFYRVRRVVGYYPIGAQGMIVGIAVDLSALPYFFRSFSGPYRAGVPDRLVPVGSDCASRREAVSRGSPHSRSKKRVGVGSGVLARPSGRRGSRRGRPEVGRCWKRALFLLREAFRLERQAGVGSGRRSSSARPSGRRLDCPSGLSLMFLGWPMSCASFATLSAGSSLCWDAGL